jgi:hypothetical protein
VNQPILTPGPEDGEQLNLFDLDGPAVAPDGVDAHVEALVTQVLAQVPKEDHRYFLLRLRFQSLLQELARFSQREREQFVVWLVEAVLQSDKDGEGQ